jgi:hypothetical protein
MGEMHSISLQTKPKLSLSGATVHRKLNLQKRPGEGTERLSKAHESEVLSLIGHFSTGCMTTISPQTAPDSGVIVHRKLIRKKELAKELSVSPRTIDNWVHQKRIPVHRLSPRLLRYDLRKVQKALDKYEVIEAGRKLS